MKIVITDLEKGDTIKVTEWDNNIYEGKQYVSLNGRMIISSKHCEVVK
jgi:hypothetical protein